MYYKFAISLTEAGIRRLALTPYAFVESRNSGLDQLMTTHRSRCKSCVILHRIAWNVLELDHNSDGRSFDQLEIAAMATKILAKHLRRSVEVRKRSFRRRPGRKALGSLICA